MKPTRYRAPEESGETLVELLISIAILGITLTALLSGVMLASSSSTLDRRAIQAQSLLKSWGELIAARTLDSGSGTTYQTCATPGSYPSGWAYDSAVLNNDTAPPHGFTPSIVKVEHWSKANAGDSSATVFKDSATSGCTGSSDTGVQRITLQMQLSDAVYPGLTAKFVVVVRRPCATAAVC